MPLPWRSASSLLGNRLPTSASTPRWGTFPNPEAHALCLPAFPLGIFTLGHSAVLWVVSMRLAELWLSAPEGSLSPGMAQMANLPFPDRREKHFHNLDLPPLAVGGYPYMLQLLMLDRVYHGGCHFPKEGHHKDLNAAAGEAVDCIIEASILSTLVRAQASSVPPPGYFFSVPSLLPETTSYKKTFFPLIS